MNKRRLFLFEWDRALARERTKDLRSAGWIVQAECEDGARGGKKVLQSLPDVVVFDLAKRPSHSRETANGIRSYKAGRAIPIVFVDGSQEDIKKTKAKVGDAVFTTSLRLKAALHSSVEKSGNS
jgi:CheY-like chemotaxis protein